MRAVIYAAKSTKDKHLSIPEQLEDCREMCEENGWQIDAEFSDENFTAYTGNRGPGLAAAIQRAKEIAAEDGEVCIVTQHTSRFARGNGAAPGAARALVELYHEWARANVQGRLVENDMAMRSSSAAAQQGEADHNESKRKSKSVSKGLRRRARDRGELAGGTRPYGYRWQGARGEKTLIIDLTEAVMVQRIFQDTINGVSQRALARRLIEEGVPTVNGAPWGQSTIGKIVTNPLYKGLIKHKGEEYPSAYPTIVPEDLWERANTVRSSAARRRGGRWPKGTHLLVKGILRCGQCGYAMTPRTDPGRKEQWRPYECYECSGRRARGVDFCDQRTFRREVIDKALLADLTSRWIDMDETRRRISERVTADLAIAREALAAAHRESQKSEDALNRIERDYIDGNITAEQWGRLEATLRQEREATAAALERAREHVNQVEQSTALADADTALLEHLADIRAAVANGVDSAPDLSALRQTIAQLFDRVLLLPADHPLTRHMDDQGTGIYLLPVVQHDEIPQAVLSVPGGETGHVGLVSGSNPTPFGTIPVGLKPRPCEWCEGPLPRTPTERGASARRLADYERAVSDWRPRLRRRLDERSARRSCG